MVESGALKWISSGNLYVTNISVDSDQPVLQSSSSEQSDLGLHCS